ncbi:Conserved_hypothetical protein [Hexamita inflata]|uniref:Uncharacterized protein n=1 Tax=Hexamita inflata TaxID=28002 RepID=A0ABP1GIL0_9EUKA
MWQASFSKALKHYLQCEYGYHLSTDQQIFDQLQQVIPKRGVWIQVGLQLNITSNQAHDYYHNTWIKQFLDSFEEYKWQLKNLIDSEKYDLNKTQLVNKIIQDFTQKHPDKKFHIMSIRQFIIHYYERIKTKKLNITVTKEAKRTDSDLYAFLKNLLNE